MKNFCPNSKCEFYKKNNLVIKDGTFKRFNDSKKIQRYKCKSCSKRFSASTNTLEYKQKKRRVNHILFKLLASNVSMRRCAIILGINKNTVSKKFNYLAKKAELKQEDFLEKLKEKPVIQVQLDDLITIEHTKLKPLSVSVAVDKTTRKILGAEVSRIPAFGLIAEKSRKKYGKRKSELEDGIKKLFDNIKNAVSNEVIIETDEHHLYPQFIKKYFPKGMHAQFKSEKATIAGQGELKKIIDDPLFVINHTLAMLRANINRLIRRTWCSTKKPGMLKKHLDIFIHFYNFYLLK